MDGNRRKEEEESPLKVEDIERLGIENTMEHQNRGKLIIINSTVIFIDGMWTIEIENNIKRKRITAI